MNKDLRLAIVDDHTMFRKGLASLISLFPQCTILFDSGGGKECIDQIQGGAIPDIILMDIVMPDMDGYSTTAWIRDHYPDISVLALSTMDAEMAIIRMIRCGAKGYLLKDADPVELKTAFSQVISLGYYYNELVSRQVIQSANQVDPQSQDAILGLSDRESQFLRLACSEATYAEIAKEMFVSSRTIDGYRDSLFKKLNIGSRVGLVLYAIRNGIVIP